MQPHRCANRGIVNLLAAVVIGAIGISIASALLFMRLTTTRTSLILEQSAMARALANACAEEALQALKEDVYYTGSTTLPMSDGTCTIRTVLGAGNRNRTVEAIGAVRNVTRRVQVIVSHVQPTTTLQSWLEVADF